MIFFFECSVTHRYLHVLTHSCPTRRSSDLMAPSGRNSCHGAIANFFQTADHDPSAANGFAILGDRLWYQRQRQQLTLTFHRDRQRGAGMPRHLCHPIRPVAHWLAIDGLDLVTLTQRSEESRIGNAWSSSCRFRGCPYHYT